MDQLKLGLGCIVFLSHTWWTYCYIGLLSEAHFFNKNIDVNDKFTRQMFWTEGTMRQPSNPFLINNCIVLVVNAYSKSFTTHDIHINGFNNMVNKIYDTR